MTKAAERLLKRKAREQARKRTVAPLLRRIAIVQTKAANRQDEIDRDKRQRQRVVLSKADSRHTADVRVESPYGHGLDEVKRVFSTIESMHKRHQIDDRQKMAFQRYNWAFETCPGSIRCALDQSGRGDGGSPQSSPTDNQIQAVEYLQKARLLLGVTDNKVAQLVCGEGLSLEDVARRLFHTPVGKRPLSKQVVVIGDRIRTALTVLADEWWPERHRIRSVRGEGATPAIGDEREAWDPLEHKGRVAHAADSGARGSNAPGKVFGFEPMEGHQDLQLKQSRERGRKRAKERA